LTSDPTAQALSVLSKYDPHGKGYFDAADVAAVFAKDTSLGDPAKAADVIAAWDGNGDGQVTKDELINGFTTLNLADAIMAQFDPTGAGTIDLSTIGNNTTDAIPNAEATLTSWDSNKDGKLTRDDVIAGIRSLNNTSSTPAPSSQDPATLFSTYDTNGDGVISADELTANSSSPATQNSDAAGIMAAWDTNADGTISKQEFTDGFNLIKQATGIVSQYDLSGKGYFDQSDLQAAIDSNTANAAGPSAADLMAFWDANGDGKVTVPDVLAGLAQGGSVAQSETPSVDTTSLDKLYAAYGYSAAATTPTAG
jgi:Ca2+-binding EF-hand superfamily protein